MPKKRTSAESRQDEPTNDSSDSASQKDNSKRAKLTHLSDTTLEAVSNHLLKGILVKAVTMEVQSLKLSKRVWKEKANAVIERLKAVCLRWSSILTTNEFRPEVYRILDDTAEETIRMEIVQQAWLNMVALKAITVKEEVLILVRQDDELVINVCNRSSIGEVKDVVELPAGMRPIDLEVGHASNCVYVVCMVAEPESSSVLRLAKDEESSRFTSSPWISDLKLPVATVSVAPSGIVVVSYGRDPVKVCVYDANGRPMLSADIFGFDCIDRVIRKTNGNILLASLNGNQCKRVLTEFDCVDGRIVKQYQSTLHMASSVNVADLCGRIVITNPLRGIHLLDSELNSLELSVPQQFVILDRLHYNNERNEVVSVCSFDAHNSLVTIFRLAEE